MATFERPCQWCAAAWDNDAECCLIAHEHHPLELLPLATAMACLFQSRTPSDQQIGWFMANADAVIDDFDPRPEKWRLRNLPESRGDDFIARFRINDVTYVIQDGEAETPVRLSTLRQWQREADEAARAR